MKRLTFTVPLLMLCGCMGLGPNAYNADHLDPDLGVLSGSIYDDFYHLKVRIILRKGYTEDVVLRVVGVPAFGPEWVVVVRKANNTYAVSCIVAEKPLTLTEIERTYADPKQIPKDLRDELPRDWREIGVQEASVSIQTNTAILLTRVWAAMLERVEYPRLNPFPQKNDFGSVRLDGENYYFSMFVKSHGDAAGTTWSPEPKTKTGRFVALAAQLRELVTANASERQTIENKIGREAQTLLEELQRSQPYPGRYRR